MSRRFIERTTAAVSAAVVLSCFLVLQTTTVAQDPGRQLIDDAVAAMGGRDRIMAVKTLMFEGGGHDFQVDQEFAYDELGSQFLVYQLRDYKRSYDLANGRGRFEQIREAQSTIFNGERPGTDRDRRLMATSPSTSAPTETPPAPSRRRAGASSICVIHSH